MAIISAPSSEPKVLAVVLGLMICVLLGGGFGIVLSGGGLHWVAAPPSDVNGMPLFGWTRLGVDLYVPHFFGLQAIQALPFFAFLLGEGLSVRAQRAAVIFFACAFCAFASCAFASCAFASCAFASCAFAYCAFAYCAFAGMIFLQAISGQACVG